MKTLLAMMVAAFFGCPLFGALTDGLVAHYKFDGNANDSSGNNQHLTNVGAAKLVTGRKGDANGAYEFNGTSTSKLSADPAVIVRGDFSYSLWFQTSELMSSHGSSGTAWNPGNDIIHSGFKDYEYVGAGLRVGTDGLAVVEHGGMYRSTVFQYKKNIGTSWHHVVVVVTAGRGEVVYLDGEYVGEAEINSSTLTSVHGNGVKAIRLDGNGVGGGEWGYYTGCIDDLRIYNRAISATEVKALYDGQEDAPPREAGTFVIAFDANGGPAVMDSIYRKIGEVYGTLPIVTRNGYLFDGWYTAAKEGRKVSASTKVTTDITLYAHWRVRGAAGFLTKTFTGSSFNADGNVWAADSDFVQRADKIYAKDLSEKTTVAYGGYMFMVGGVVYNFKGCYDDFATVRVDGKDVVSKGDECRERSGNYTPKETGWHEVEFRVANNGGGWRYA